MSLIAAQRDRWILWAPVALLAGAACYFTAPAEPDPWFGALIAGAAISAGLAALFWPSRRARRRLELARQIGVCALFAVATFGVGFAAAQIRTFLVASPRLAAELGPVGVQGWVVASDIGPKRERMTILVKSIEGLQEPPRYVRLSTPLSGAMQPGRFVRCYAKLRPPDGPLVPQGYDPALRAYFTQVGASGFTFGRCRPQVFEPPADFWRRAIVEVAALRRAATEQIYYASPTQGGAVAASFITGERGLLTEETNAALRDSGLAHLLSVSGVHMSILSGMVYAALYFALSLAPGLSLRFPIRKWAAGTAIAVAAVYLVASGLSVPAQRAFIMMALMMGAILADRPAISMRTLAVAAILILLTAPESALDAGFQMSFAAATALVATFERRRFIPRDALPAPGLLVGGLTWIWRCIAAALLASFVAGTATDPFAAYHFQRFTLYSLPANIVSDPITALIVAPAAGVAGILAPFGLSDPAFAVMGWGLDLLTAIAKVFAGAPHAVQTFARPPDAAFLCLVGALMWACLWNGRLRWGALAPAAAGVALYAMAPQPAILADADLDVLIARARIDKHMHWVAVKPGRPGQFALERMAGMRGLSAATAQTLPPPQQCGADFCRWISPEGRDAWQAFTLKGLDAACVPNAIVITKLEPPTDWPARCAPAALVTGGTLRQWGGVSMIDTPQGVEIYHARSSALRPWSAAPTSMDAKASNPD